MNTSKFLKWIILFILTLNINTMNAQNKSDTLNAQEQGLVAISALTATGDLEKLNTELHAALDAGLSINEIKEALTYKT